MLRVVLFGYLLLLWMPVSAAAEEIMSFSSDIVVESDGSLLVTETIVYDFAAAERRGIFRTLPTKHPQTSGTWYTDRVIDITVERVLRGSGSAPFTQSQGVGNITLKIGDPDVTISGAHTYTITYNVVGALTYYDDGTVDLYWNATGDEWSVLIRQAEVSVSGEALETMPLGSCYVGRSGDTTACPDAEQTDTGVRFEAYELMPGTGLTIAQALDPSVVAVQIEEEWNLWWLWLLGALLWFVGLGVYSYRYHHRHNPRHAIMTQYEPYADWKPMFTGVLLDGTLHSRDITAGILYLADQGFLRITKLEKTVLWVFTTDDYQIELLRDPRETDTHFQRELLRLLFGDMPMSGNIITLSELKKDTTTQTMNRRRIAKLKKGIEADLVSEGFYEQKYQPALRHSAVALAGLAAATLVVVALGLAGPELFVGAFILAIVTGILLAVVSTRRTEKGYAAKNHLEGFKKFLSMTGADRYAFHDAPTKSPEQFTEYLPYAVAFAVEKEWAEVFADITIPQPSWYQDASGSTQFAAMSFVNDMDAFSQSFSQSSGSSASSGGGSAGGGAGGGGGGSW